MSDLLGKIGNGIMKGFNALLDFLAAPLLLLFELLQGVFYFIVKLFEIIVLVVQIFVSLFQFIFSLAAGIFRTTILWLNPVFRDNNNYPSTSAEGMNFVFEILTPTGFMTVIPMGITALLWITFTVKIIGLFRGGESD